MIWKIRKSVSRVKSGGEKSDGEKSDEDMNEMRLDEELQGFDGCL